MDLPLALTLIGIVLLLVSSAFFSGSETALTGASKPKLHGMAKEGTPGAERIDKLTDDMPGILATILLGNNLVNIGASAMATGLFLNWFGEAGILVATLVMTFLVLIFSEVLPKTIAALHPEQFSLRIGLPMQWLMRVLFPLTWLVRRISQFLMKLMGLNPDISAGLDEHDLRGAIGLGLQQDVLDKEEHRMLDSIFDLDDVTVADIMTHRSNMVALDASLSAKGVFKAIQQSAFSRLPVWEGEPDNIIGTVHVRDVLTALHNGKHFDLKTIMNDPYFVPDVVPIGKQLFEFKRTRRHMGLVVDEYGDLLGLVTLEDVLEEIVGEIEDEHDVVSSDFMHHKDGSITVSGDYPIRDANREFDWNLPEDEDAVTLSGLIIEETQRIPSVGETITIENVTFKVLKREQQVLTRLKGQKTEKTKDS